MHRQRLVCFGLFLATGATAMAGDGPKFDKYKLDKAFWSEGVAIGDINKDGKMDVFAGDVWYENLGEGKQGLAFKRHDVRPFKPLAGDFRKQGGDPNGSPHDGSKTYSRSFAVFAGDFNKDGWVDFIVVNFPGEDFHWYENPQGKDGHWKEHQIWRSGCNETPTYGDLLGDGKPGIMLGSMPEAQIIFLRPGEDPTKTWTRLEISQPKSPGTDRFYHGLGMTDVNGDGRLDALIPDGWWEQPKDPGKSPWEFHKLALTPPKHNPPDPAREQRTMADLFATDVDGDGDLDLIGSCAHKYGIWWFENVGSNAAPKYVSHLIREDISETHAMRFEDIDGDGKKDIITGKRFFSHMRNEPGSLDPAYLIWIKIGNKDGKPTFTSHVIDDDSGVGTQFHVGDFNGDGKLDVISANKKGVQVFVQKASSPAAN
ncbi:MAG TPA: VCBS repeat-containing protein [Planctomycetia bacterium]|nr:VCBS repeat-containing protein [Planctomycetia bacterium]